MATGSTSLARLRHAAPGRICLSRAGLLASQWAARYCRYRSSATQLKTLPNRSGPIRLQVRRADAAKFKVPRSRRGNEALLAQEEFGPRRPSLWIRRRAYRRRGHHFGCRGRFEIACQSRAAQCRFATPCRTLPPLPHLFDRRCRAPTSPGDRERRTISPTHHREKSYQPSSSP